MIDLNQGFFLTFLSSCLCVCGCLIIFIDDLYRLVFPRFITRRFEFTIKENYGFMNACLSFSAGCLTFAALYGLLPEAKSYLQKSYDEGQGLTLQQLSMHMFISFTLGIALCLSFNMILHLITSESVVHCKHGGHNGKSHVHEVPLTTDSHGSDLDHHHHHHHHHHQNDNDVQHDKLISSSDELHLSSKTSNTSSVDCVPSSSQYQTPKNSAAPVSKDSCHDHNHNCETENPDETTSLLYRKKSIIHFFTPDDDVVGECKGYASAEVVLFNQNSNLEDRLVSSPVNITGSVSDFVSIPKCNSEPYHDHSDTLSQDLEDPVKHHHHVTNPQSHLLLIAVETTLAIVLHKLPEGFVTYITSETNKAVGFQIFLSLTVHNFTEGFSMCLPLYYSMAGRNSSFAKLKAVLISATLGGLSQPIGAFCGYVFLAFNTGENIDLRQLNYIFGLTMAGTSGFLTVVALSMFSSAIAFNRGSSNLVMLWCLAGMVLIGFSGVLSGKLK